MNFNGILIGSDDPQRLVEFYAGLFGEPAWNMGGYVGWMIGSGYITVGPHSEVSGQNREPGRLLWNIESQDVRADFERFTAAGATVVAEPYGAGEESDEDGLIATVADPDGNYFQLMSPMPADMG